MPGQPVTEAMLVAIVDRTVGQSSRGGPDAAAILRLHAEATILAAASTVQLPVVLPASLAVHPRVVDLLLGVLTPAVPPLMPLAFIMGPTKPICMPPERVDTMFHLLPLPPIVLILPRFRILGGWWLGVVHCSLDCRYENLTKCRGEIHLFGWT